jgi:hypothetical protein
MILTKNHRESILSTPIPSKKLSEYDKVSNDKKIIKKSTRRF